MMRRLLTFIWILLFNMLAVVGFWVEKYFTAMFLQQCVDV